MLAMIEITNPVYEDALDKALVAYSKAGKADTKAQKTKDICLGISDVASKYVDEAYNCYTFGDLAKASRRFESAVEARATAPLSEVDSTSLYNAGFTAWLTGDNDRALNFFLKCRDFCDAILNNGASPIPWQEIIYNQAIIDGIIRSSACGHEVEVNVPEI